MGSGAQGSRSLVSMMLSPFMVQNLAEDVLVTFLTFWPSALYLTSNGYVKSLNSKF